MPVSGPNSQSVESDSSQQVTSGDSFKYTLIHVGPRIVDTLKKRGAPLSFASFTDRAPAPDIRVQIGDILGITVFEAAPGGLFVPAEAGVRPGNYVTLPNQTVDQSGNINVPYAGTVRAAGQSLRNIQDTIESRIKNRAIEPQVMVTMAAQQSNYVSVMGEVNSPVRYALSPTGEKLLDAITRAGGPKSQGWQTWVTLQRNNRKGTVHFLSLLSNPDNNLFVQPKDNIYVHAEQRTFVVVGATGTSGTINFDVEKLSLTEAIGKAGGMLDTQANPGATYLYRMEDRQTLAEMNIDLSGWEATTTQIPVVYHLNFRNGGEFLLATQFPMKNKDVLFVSNAASVELTKVMQFIRIGSAFVKETVDLKNIQ